MASKTSANEAYRIIESSNVDFLPDVVADGRKLRLVELIAEALDKAFAEGMDAHKLEERLNWLRKGTR